MQPGVAKMRVVRLRGKRKERTSSLSTFSVKRTGALWRGTPAAGAPYARARSGDRPRTVARLHASSPRWADRVQLIDAEYDGARELPAIGAVTAPSAVLIRPDGYV